MRVCAYACESTFTCRSGLSAHLCLCDKIFILIFAHMWFIFVSRAYLLLCREVIIWLCLSMCTSARVCASPENLIIEDVCMLVRVSAQAHSGIWLFFFVARNISVCAQIRGKKRVYLCDLWDAFYLHVVEAKCMCTLPCAFLCVYPYSTAAALSPRLWCVTDTVMCHGATDAVHIWWETQPTMCGLIQRGMIQAITHTQRHPLAQTTRKLTLPPNTHTNSPPPYRHTLTYSPLTPKTVHRGIHTQKRVTHLSGTHIRHEDING